MHTIKMYTEKKYMGGGGGGGEEEEEEERTREKEGRTDHKRTVSGFC